LKDKRVERLEFL